MASILTCVLVEHDLRLVVLAALVCAAASAAAFGFHARALRARAMSNRLAWIGLTGLVAGSGVWATHFIAMLAYQPQLPIGYAPVETALSLVMAIVGMGLGFAFPVLQPGRVVAMASGGLTGMAVGAMHFTGVAAMRAQARFEWDVGYVVAAVVIGVVAGAAAFAARSAFKGHARWVAAATLLLLGIVGLHFTAMAAVRLLPDPAMAVPSELAGRAVLASAAAVMVAMLLTAGGSLIVMERLGRRATLGGLRDALDVVPSALSFYDARNRLLSWNRAYERMMRDVGIAVSEGMPRHEMVDAALRAGWRPLDGSDYLERRRDAINGASPAMHLLTTDGRTLRHESFATADGGGVTVMTDVTEQLETTRVLAQARDAAEAANRAKSQFLANMSHEIRTPLNGVLGVADVLAGTALSGRQRELVGVIQDSGSLLNALLTDLLDLARVEAGAAVLRPEAVSLAGLAASVRGLYAARAEQKGLALDLEIAPEAGGRVACDALRLRQVLGNLVNNAVKFTDKGRVVLTLSRAGDAVRFEVRDTGPGFDSAMKAALFGRFQQADDSSTRRHGGAGLGLAICREYVALMGGVLDAQSEPGAGAVFAFDLDLPLLASEPETDAGAAGSMDAGQDARMDLRPDAGADAESDTARAPPEPGRVRILVVDDNAVNRQVLGLMLDAVGIEHAAADDGSAGLAAAMTGAFDAVLMDIQMPVMDGFESTRRIRAWERSSGRERMPILIVSANGLQEHVDAGIAAGADAHLNKPVSVPQLLGALETHVIALREAA
ncbi:MHYT domain-containing protein [Phenylobacterium sp.]|uniref:ATP-binding protein n=1 Tax=Phenylobacterium sp. TaxID=1871053 RepID=UPI00301D3964